MAQFISGLASKPEAVAAGVKDFTSFHAFTKVVSRHRDGALPFEFKHGNATGANVAGMVKALVRASLAGCSC